MAILTRQITTVLVATAVVAAVIWFSMHRPSAPEAVAKTPLPNAAQVQAPAEVGGGIHKLPGGYSGYGWSIIPDTALATRQALARAIPAATPPDLLVTLYTSWRDPRQLIDAAHQSSSTMRMIGISTADGLLSPDGFHGGADGAIALLALRVPGVTIGVGGASFDEADPAKAAGLALDRAMADAQRTDRPAMILHCVTTGHEEQVLATIQQRVPNVPLVGGSASPSKRYTHDGATTSPSAVVCNGQVMPKGVAVALFYSQQPFGYAFHGGFDKTSKSGTITDADDRVIRTIDKRPAFDVFDEWLGGRLSEAVQNKIPDLSGFTGMYPLTRIVTCDGGTHNHYVHARPSLVPGQEKILLTAANVKVGEVVYYCEGTWNTLLNRFAALPNEARAQMKPRAKTAAAIMVVCDCVARNIPAENKQHMAFLVDKSLGGIPWIGMATSGEQGYVPGQGLLHTNLTTGAILIPEDGGE